MCLPSFKKAGPRTGTRTSTSESTCTCRPVASKSCSAWVYQSIDRVHCTASSSSVDTVHHRKQCRRWKRSSPAMRPILALASFKQLLVSCPLTTIASYRRSLELPQKDKRTQPPYRICVSQNNWLLLTRSRLWVSRLQDQDLLDFRLRSQQECRRSPPEGSLRKGYKRGLEPPQIYPAVGCSEAHRAPACLGRHLSGFGFFHGVRTRLQGQC